MTDYRQYVIEPSERGGYDDIRCYECYEYVATLYRGSFSIVIREIDAHDKEKHSGNTEDKSQLNELKVRVNKIEDLLSNRSDDGK